MCRINRRSLLTSAATLAGSGLLVHTHAGAAPHVHTGSLTTDSTHPPTSSASLMTETANRFLAALGPEQRAKTTFKFEDDERTNWHFIPKERKGLPLREMSPYQKHLASGLLSAGSLAWAFSSALSAENGRVPSASSIASRSANAASAVTASAVVFTVSVVASRQRGSSASN